MTSHNIGNSTSFQNVISDRVSPATLGNGALRTKIGI